MNFEQLHWRKNMVHSKNKTLKVLLDTNIIVDVMLEREPFYKASNEIMKLCHNKELKGYIAFHSFPNIWYILRKAGSDDMRRALLLSLVNFFDIPETNKKHIRDALYRTDFPDFEDCLQDESALSVQSDYIITRNKDDFKNSKVPAYLPEEFINLMAAL